MRKLVNVSCGDAYTTAAMLDGVFDGNGGYFAVTANDVFMKLAWGPSGQEKWTDEVHVPIGGGVFAKGTVGCAFRNFTAGKVAVVSAALAEKTEPPIQIAASGQAAPASSGGSGLFTVSNTIAGLGVGAAGAAGLLEMGAVPPGEFLMVVFDAALNHWVSPETLIFDQGTATSGFNTIGETDLFASGRGLHDYRDYVNAGLTPYFRTLGLIGKTSAIANSTMTLGMQLASQNAGTPEASIGAYGATFGTTARTVTGANIWQFDTGWATPAALPTTADELALKLRANVSDGSDAKSWSSLKTFLRWLG